MDNSPLNKLPRELRDEIYHLALRQSEEVRPYLDNMFSTFRRTRRNDCGRHALALTATCKQSRRESRGVFFQINTFGFDAHIFDQVSEYSWHLDGLNYAVGSSDLANLREWMAQVGRYNNSALHKVNINLRGTESIFIQSWHWVRKFVLNEIVKTINCCHSKAAQWTITLAVDDDKYLDDEDDEEETLGVVNFYEMKIRHPQEAIQQAVKEKTEELRRAVYFIELTKKDESRLLQELRMVSQMVNDLINAIAKVLEED